MDTTPTGDELIDVVVRLSRKMLEDTLLAATGSPIELDARRLGEAKALLTGRRRRTACFSGVRFGDPSWDMILELYVARGECRWIAVSQLCSLSGVSSTTALRHLEHLEALGYISREADKTDRRRARVTMLAPLVDAVEQWLDLQLAAMRLGA